MSNMRYKHQYQIQQHIIFHISYKISLCLGGGQFVFFSFFSPPISFYNDLHPLILRIFRRLLAIPQICLLPTFSCIFLFHFGPKLSTHTLSMPPTRMGFYIDPLHPTTIEHIRISDKLDKLPHYLPFHFSQVIWGLG